MTETTTHGAYGGAQSPQPSRQPYTGVDGERGQGMMRTPAGTVAASGVRSREPLARGERLQIALLAGLFTLVAAMMGAGVLGYTALSGQLLAIQQNMHEEIGGLRTDVQHLSERIARVEALIEIHHGSRPGS